MRLDYRPGLDGLRAVAVILVLIFHSDLGWLPGGFLGVSVFFTLSGFLITSLLIAEMESRAKIDLAAFWERRFRRLLPAALVTIGTVSFTGIWLSTTVEQSRLRGDAIAAVFYGSNWRSILAELSYEEIFSTKSPLIHLWSLSIEEQMYVVLPLIASAVMALGWSRRAFGFTALGLAGVSALVGVVAVSGDRLYYGTDARAAELLVGVAAATFVGPRVWRESFRLPAGVTWVPMLALIAIIGLARVSTTDSEWIYAGVLPAFALVSLICVVGSLTPGPLRRLLAVGPLVAIGKISYGLYLYHWPIFTWIDEDRLGMGGISLFAVRIGATAAITVLSYRVIEQPIRTRRMFKSPKSFVAATVVAVVVTLGIPLTFLRTVSGETTTDIQVLSTVPSSTVGVSPTVDDPVLGRPERYLVIGDSTAENVARALATTGSIGVVSAGVLGCPLVDSIEVFDRPRASQETSYCPDNLDIVRRHAPDIDVVLIVGGVSNQWSYRTSKGDVVDPGGPQYRQDFDLLMEEIQEALAPWAVPIILLDNPRTRPDEGVLGDEDEAHAAWRSQIERWDQLWETVARVSIDDVLAPADSDAGRVQRPDGVHLEETFAADLARTVLRPRVESAYANLIALVDRIECRVNGADRRRFDLVKCRAY